MQHVLFRAQKTMASYAENMYFIACFDSLPKKRQWPGTGRG